MQSEGLVPKESYAHQEYTSKKRERYEIRKPRDSDIFKADGPFVSETQKDIDYVPKKGERYATSRPQESDVWKVTVSLCLLKP